MCDNCLVEEECTCPEGTPLVHCACDPYYNQFCTTCGHAPWTKDRSRAPGGEKKHRPLRAK